MTPCPCVIGDGGARKEGGVDMKHMVPGLSLGGSRGGVRGEGSHSRGKAGGIRGGGG